MDGDYLDNSIDYESDDIEFEGDIEVDDEDLVDAGEVDVDDVSFDDLDEEIAALEKELGEDSFSDLSPVKPAEDSEELGIMDYLPKAEEGKEPVMKDSSELLNIAGEVVVQNTDIDDDVPPFEFKRIPLESINITQRIRKHGSVQSLEKSIQSTGLLQPIVVAPLMTAGMYVLIDGLRRLRACAKCGMSVVPAIVNNNISTTEIPVVEAMYNHSKTYNMDEVISYIKYLENEKGVTNPNMIEYLLQLNTGDYTKLKDILNDGDPDIADKLYNNEMTIAEAFRKLEQRRKKETQEEKELQKTDKAYSSGEEGGVDNIKDVGDSSFGAPLSEEQVSSLESKISDFTDVENMAQEQLDEMVDEANRIPGFEPNKQDWKNRERLAPELRKAILARDNNTCQVCKMISGQEYTEVLDIHHIQEVYLGGDDSEENLITACVVCHKLIHLFARGSLYIRPYDEMPKEEQDKFKRIVKLGTKIRLDMRAKNMSKEELKKVDKADTIGRTKPGTGQVAG